MLITSITITKIKNPKNKMLGLAKIVLDDMLCINSIKVISSDNGMFLAMPSRMTKSGDFKDVAHPVNKDVRAVFENLIFSAYNEADKKDCTQLRCVIKERPNGLLEQKIEDFEILDVLTDEISEN